MSNYYYFVASLPMLHFDMKPPFSYEVFLDKCRQLISDSDYAVISSIPETQDAADKGTVLKKRTVPFGGNDTIKRWITFDTQLRNELVRIRSARRHADPSKYLRPDGSVSTAIPHIALAAHRSPSILEGERLLDRERWNFLNELELGHYFDVDFLVVYARKLRILARWDRVRSSDKDALLERMLQNA